MNRHQLIVACIISLSLNIIVGLFFQYHIRNLMQVLNFSTLDIIIFSYGLIHTISSAFIIYYYWLNKLIFSLTTLTVLALVFIINLWGFRQVLHAELAQYIYLITYYSASVIGLIYGISLSLIKGERFKYIRYFGFAIILLQLATVMTYLISSFGIMRHQLVNLYTYFVYFSLLSPSFLLIHFFRMLKYNPELEERNEDILDEFKQ